MPLPEPTSMPILALSLANLRLGDLIDSIDAPTAAATKRKAPCTGHHGLANDSSLAVRLVALSRLMRARDDDILHPAAQSPVGIAVLDALRAAVLRVAVASGGADSAMSEMQVTTFFNLSASHVATKRLYNGGLSLPSKLPWERAKALLAALLDSLSSARGADVGYRVGERLLQLPAPALDATAQVDVAAMVSLVECNMSKRLSGLSEGDASSAASSSSTPPPSLPMPPLQPGQPQPQMVPAEPVAPFVLDATASLGANLGRLVAMRMRRSTLQPEEQLALDGALEEGLSVLSAETAEAQRQLLAATAIVALSNVGAAQLWACSLEACGDGEVESVAALAAEITAHCGTIASALLAAALLGD